MGWFDYETQIEDQLVDQLSRLNTTVQISRFYENASPMELMNFVISKVKSVPSAFVRCTGGSAEQDDTIEELLRMTYSVQIILAANDHGKGKQIKAQKRKVNILAATIMARLNGFRLDLSEQPPQPIVFRSIRDLFTTQSIDARIIELEVPAVMIDMNDIGLESAIEDLLNG